MNIPPRIKFFLKFVFAGVLHYSGLLFLYGRLACRRKTTALMYHRVLPDHLRNLSNSNSALAVSDRKFAEQMRFIKRWYRPAGSDVLGESSSQSRRLSVIVTFDDGWQDNYFHAAPVLHELDIPAVIFLATDYIGTEELFWQEKMMSTLVDRWLNPPDFECPLVGDLSAGISEGDLPAFRRSAEAYVSGLKSRPSSEVELVFKKLGTRAATAGTDTVDRFMSWAEVREMQEQGIEFGSHTASHRMLTKLTDDEIISELELSANRISEKLGTHAGLFAYPNGDQDDRVQRLVGDFGFRYAFGVLPGFADAREHMNLRRMMVHDGISPNIAMFHCHLLGII